MSETEKVAHDDLEGLLCLIEDLMCEPWDNNAL